MYIVTLANTQHLPPIAADSPVIEAHQPPLYYLLMAGVTGWLDKGDVKPELSRIIRRNPFWNGDIGAIGHTNKNQYLHGRDEQWPYQGLIFQLHLIRILSLLLGAGTVVVLFCTARTLFPSRPGLALGALALVAFQPQLLFISSAINNDTLEMLFASLVFWQLVLLIRDGPSWPRSLAVGVLLGLAVLTKLSGLLLAPVIAGGVAVALWRRQQQGETVSFKKFLLTCLPGLLLPLPLLAGWWVGRNQRLYHEWNTLTYYHQIFGYRHPQPSLWQALGELRFVQWSFWAWFGGGNVPVDWEYYLLINVFCLLALLGLLRWAWQQSRSTLSTTAQLALPEAGIQAQILALFSGAVLLYLASIVRYTQLDVGGPAGRFLFPVIVPLALILYLGASHWFPRRWEIGVAVITNVIWGLFAIIALLGYLAPAYQAPPVLTAEEVAAIPHPRQAIFADRIELLGYKFSRPTALAGQSFRLTLYWRALRSLSQDYSEFIHVYDVHGHPVAGLDTYTGSGNYLTSSWRAGQVFADTYDLAIASDAPAPERVLLEVGLIDPVSGARLPVQDEAGNSGTAEHLDWISVYPANPPAAPTIAHPATFANYITLLGYTTRLSEPGTLQIRLSWRATAPVGHDYVVFVHLVDGQRRQVAQQDSEPRQATYPTSFWRPGEPIEDTYALKLPPGIPPTSLTTLQLEVGLYDYATGKRLDLLTPGTLDRENAVVLPVS